jgi:hypothetical protein
MIVSQFHLLLRVATDDPGYSFEILLTNLEPVELQFRLRFVAPVVWDHPATLTTLRAHARPLGEEVMGTGLTGVHDWTRSGDLHIAHWDYRIKPGATRRAGLSAAGSLTHSPGSDEQVFGPTYLRGYWELSLPPIAATPHAVPKAQLGHDARVLVACFRRTVRRRGSRVLQDDMVPFPLASGRAEHLIPAEKSEVSASPAVSAAPALKRAAPKRARAKRR